MKFKNILIALLVAILSIGHQAAQALTIYIPKRCKTEGRVTLIKAENNQLIKYHLPFTETIDFIEERSALSIGYVSYEPTRYVSRKDSPSLTVDPNGKCVSQSDGQAASPFVPTLSWFIEEMFPNHRSKMSYSPHLVGPFGMIFLADKLAKSAPEPEQRQTVHRNIPCTVFSFQYPLADEGITLILELYLPSDIIFNSLQTTYFTVKATTYNTLDSNAIKPTSSGSSQMRASFVIDYYFIDDATNDGPKFDRLMRNDFNVPLGSGCSEFLKQLEPSVSERQSFSMSYRQLSSISTHTLAYDHSSGLLRKELVGESVSIWDLNEDLMYHTNGNAATSMLAFADERANVKACSVTRVTDERLGPAFRPYERAGGQPIDMLRLIGASAVSYMGRGSVRDLPCSIYETIIEQPPLIFAATAEQLQSKSSIPRRYIVQFYLLEAASAAGPDSSAADHERLPENGFWPAQINLYRQFTDTGHVEHIDQLEVYDFFWSIDGWSKRNNELFMAAECFDDANKQLKLELALTFDKVHRNNNNNDNNGHRAMNESVVYANLLPYNKFKLEYELIDDLFRLFGVSKMHLIEYELKLRPSHLDVRLLIADRSAQLELAYFGEGQLVAANSYEENRIELHGQSEESCVSMSSLIADISMVVYCPFDANRAHASTCMAVFDQQEPVFQNAINTDPLVPTCHVYRFKPGPMPAQAIGEVLSRKQQLHKRPIRFQANVLGDEQSRIDLEGRVEDFELTHDIELLVVANHEFVLEQPQQQQPSDGSGAVKLRSFDTIAYGNENDCERICNLDTHCRSYSFCKSSSAASNRCVLASLDIRSARLFEQLLHAQPPIEEPPAAPGGEQKATAHVVVVNDGGHDASEYKLRFEDSCHIYERNYLSYYKQTDELVSLNRALAKQLPTAQSTFECAKMSIDTEASHSEHHVAMFAYCESTNVCLMDENLFGAPDRINGQQNETGQRHADEMLCRIYRKKYQTYFGISSRIIKQQQPSSDGAGGGGGEQTALAGPQLELPLNTIEECARACWIRFGQVCASFDYCSPGRCTINKASAHDLADEQLEARSECLHYERDLELDRLRREHAIGRHRILVVERPTGASALWRTAASFVVYALALGAFICGLALGRKLNDKLEAVTISRQSISVGPRTLRGAAAAAADDDQTMLDYQSFPIDDYEGSPVASRSGNVIKMDLINNNIDRDEQQ